MANQEALAILKQGVKIWNVWRAGSGSAIMISRDLSYADLSDANLNGANLDYANLDSTVFGSVDLSTVVDWGP